jgi:uncharacterized membrane protein
MENEKSWWQSKTIIATIITLAISLFGMLGFKITDQEAFGENMTNIIASLGVLTTTAVAVYGRVTAVSKVVKKQPPIGS